MTLLGHFHSSTGMYRPSGSSLHLLTASIIAWTAISRPVLTRIAVKIAKQRWYITTRFISGQSIGFRKMKPITSQLELDKIKSDNGYSSEPRSLSEATFKLLYHSKHYVVLDKPCNVRMDGLFDVTVANMLVHHLGGSDKDYKFVHQLDYATSGVLCIGLNTTAAGAASQAFANRQTSKEYLAIINGELRARKDWPMINNENQRSVLRSNMEASLEEDVSIRSRNKASRQRITEASWQDAAKQQSLIMCHAALLQHAASLDPTKTSATEPDGVILDLATNVSYEEFLKDSKLRKKLRKALKAVNKLPDNLPDALAPKADPDVVPLVEESSLDRELVYDLPSDQQCFFRLPELVSGDSERILVLLPLSDVADEFRCEFGNPRNPGRSAETEIEIIAYGWYKGRRVTKVRLHPRTGRRHQLRLHLLALGHPIVGDFAYGEGAYYKSSVPDRMMLHAYKLRIPLTGEQEPVQLTSDDPFTQYPDLVLDGDNA